MVGLLIYAKPISYFIVSQLWPQEQLIETPLGKITELTGTVHRQGSNSYLGEAVSLKQPVIRHRDRLILDANAKAGIQLDSGYILQLEPNTEAVFESWGDGQTRDVVYLTLLSGDYALIQSGTPGSLYIIKNKKLFAPEIRPKESEAPVIQTEKPQRETITEPSQAQAPETTTSVEQSESPLPDEPEQKPVNLNAVGQSMPQKRTQESLDTQYIERVLASRDQLFRRCRLTSLRDQKKNTGNLLFTFVIQPSGQVGDVRLLQSDIKNTGLHSCIASVIERTKFRSFQGRSISLSYPIRFE